MALARGEYFIFLDEDDEFYPAHLASLVEAARNSRFRIIHSWSEERSLDSRGREFVRRHRREPFRLRRFVRYNFIPINAVLFHHSLYREVGGFFAAPEELEDWLLWLKFCTIEPHWYCVKAVSAVYRIPAAGKSRREWRRRLSAARVKIRRRELGLISRNGFSGFVFCERVGYFLWGWIFRSRCRREIGHPVM